MKLIKLNEEDYIIVDDFDIKEGDMFINEHNQISVCVKSLEEFLKNNTINIIKKVTHSTKPLEDIIVHNKYNAKGWVNIKQLSLSEVEELFGYSVGQFAKTEWEVKFINGKLTLKQ